MIALDLSRLLSRAGRGTPTGIDRVELAYAEHLIATGTPCCFAALAPGGRLVLLPRSMAEDFVREIGAAWRGPLDLREQERRVRRVARRARLALLIGSERRLFGMLRDSSGESVYLLVSHHHLERRRLIARLKTRSRARFVCLIHDLIPVEFPEYAKPGQAANHLRRIETAAAFADAFIVNSAVTGGGAAAASRSRRAGLAGTGGAVRRRSADCRGKRRPADRPALFRLCRHDRGAQKSPAAAQSMAPAEPRSRGRAPVLVLVGQRGWEIENVIDMLDRCPALRDTVVEHNALPDAAMVPLLRGARALLLPSFAEGFGFPVIEALQLGVPVLCSDIPALRETGGAVPEFLDPLDGPGWHRALLDYAAPESPRRAAQIARLATWRPPRWDAYFATVDRFIADVSSGQ